MAERKPLSFGIKTSQAGIGYDDILRLWREADAIEAIEHAWLWDHMIPLRGPANSPALEAWTLLAALAAQTRRLRLGVIVTNNQLRSPALLAKMAATTDIISGGRLDFGIGAGGGLLSGQDQVFLDVVTREYAAYGVPLIKAADAIRSMGEACELIRRMWTQDQPFDFSGRYYQLRGAICEPKPVRVPAIMIGGTGEKLTMPLVARHADIWNNPGQSPLEFELASNLLDQYCADIGRDPAEISRSVQIILRDGQAHRDLVEQYVEAGANHIVLAPLPPFGPLAALAAEVIEPVLSQA